MKKIAVIQFGAAKDVTAAYQTMIEIKKNNYDVREIDVKNMNEQDQSFLRNAQLYQIIIVGHSSTWDKKNYCIPHKDRMIGSSSLSEVCRIISKLAEDTTAIKFNFYPCEIADKYQGDIEIRDLKEPNGVLFNEDLLEFKAQLNKQLHKHDSYVSSLDLLTEAVLEGKEKSKNKNSYLGLSIGGQVGPGDPSRAETPGSPRKSISRELARGMLSQNKIKKNETLKLIEKADKLFFQQRKQNDACPVVWVENKFSFFEFDENYDETPDSNDNVYTCASKN